jgi:hypothetical protein
VTDRDIAGFFAAVKERVAAGCTPELDEAEYHDFTSYFVAALTGRDRLGRAVTGADYNRDRKVTTDEAYCYTLIHDASIDVPICTSDVLVRRLVTKPDEETFKTKYSDVKKWATPAQRAALEELSKILDLSGEDRAATAYARFNAPPAPSAENPLAAARRAFGQARQEGRSFLLGRFPDLRDANAPGYAAARREAAELVERRVNEGEYKALMEADAAMEKAQDEAYKKEIADARMTRFVRLFKTVALTREVKQNGEPAMKKRLEKLLAAESRTLLPKAKAEAASR